MQRLLNYAGLDSFFRQIHNCVKLSILGVIYFGCNTPISAALTNNEANKDTNLHFFLPISSNQMSGFTSSLNAALKKNKLSNISIVFADHWHDYQTALRNGRPGVYFAAPHFSAWAVNKHKFKPLLRLSEPLNFVIATKRSQPRFFELNDLIGYRVCVKKPLNLDYLLTTQAFNSRLGSINTQFVPDVITQMSAAQVNCEAFAVSNHILQRRISSGSDDYIRIYQGQTYNNYALISHPDVDPMLLKKLRDFFIMASTQKLFQPIFKLYANNTKLISSSEKDYPNTYIVPLEKYWKTDSVD